jgi:hypothetical protein
MNIGRKKHLDCHYKWKKPFVNDFSVLLGLNDKLCVKLKDNQYKCMKVSEWLDKCPLVVLVDNVVQKGPRIRSDVYQLFLNKIGQTDILEERRKYKGFLNTNNKK